MKVESTACITLFMLLLLPSSASFLTRAAASDDDGGGEGEGQQNLGFPFEQEDDEEDQRQALLDFHSGIAKLDPSSGPRSVPAPAKAARIARSLTACSIPGGVAVPDTGYCPCSGAYSCYADSTSCWSTPESHCKAGNYGWTTAEYCVDRCPDGALMDDGCCYGDDAVSAWMKSLAVEVVGNTILIQSDEIFGMLYDGYAGGGGCAAKYDGVKFATSVVLSRFKDVFDFVYTFPYYDINAATGLGGCSSQTNIGNNPKFQRASSGGALRSMVSSFPRTGGHVASQHELGHHWLVFLDSLPARKATIDGSLWDSNSHWGFTMLDKHGQQGGFNSDAFRCESPASAVPSKTQACEGNRLAPFSTSLGSPHTSHDLIGAFSKIELMIMGLYSANEIADEVLVHCKNMVATLNRNTYTYENVVCEEIVHLTAAEIEASLSSAALAKQISVGTTLRAAQVVVFDAAAGALPTTVSELQDAKWNGYVNWVHEYGPKLEDLFFENTYRKANLTFEVSEADLGCGLENTNLCYDSTSAPTPSVPATTPAPTPAPTEGTGVSSIEATTAEANAYKPYIYKGKSVTLLVKVFDQYGENFMQPEAVQLTATGGTVQLVEPLTTQGYFKLKFTAGTAKGKAVVRATFASSNSVTVPVATLQVHTQALSHCAAVVKDLCRSRCNATKKKKKACIRNQATSRRCFGPKKGTRLRKFVNSLFSKFQNTC